MKQEFNCEKDIMELDNIILLENTEVRETNNQKFEIWESENAPIPCLPPVTGRLNACTVYTGQIIETQQHVLCECMAGELGITKQNLYNDIIISFSLTITNDTQKKKTTQAE